MAHSLIGRYSKQNNCLARREKTIAQTQEESDSKLRKLRAETLALKRVDYVRAIDRYLIDFETNLAEGRVRTDNASDFNQMVRLRAFIMGSADGPQDAEPGVPTLKDLQKRYQEMQRERVQAKDAGSLPEVSEDFCGVVGSHQKVEDSVVKRSRSVAIESTGAAITPLRNEKE